MSKNMVGRFLVSTSACALLALPIAAQAACDINPAQADSLTICSGTEEDGLLVGANGASVLVEQGASVTGPGSGSIIIHSSANSVYETSSSLTVKGTVDGLDHAGIYVTTTLFPVSSPYFYRTTRSSITVDEGAVVTGTTGIDVTTAPAYYYYGTSEVTLVNNGTISGSGGIALRGNPALSARFRSIANSATGVIGAIVDPGGTISNDGLIDGGARSAISQTVYNLGYANQAEVNNHGTIRSNSAAPTILLANYYSYYPNPYAIENDGLIENLGAGAAVADYSALRLWNGANGTIRAAGNVAITGQSSLFVVNLGRIEANGNAMLSNGSLTLSNSGTIVGSVVSNVTSPWATGSVIDTREGRIEGDVRLGAADDILVSNIDSYGTITGVLDAGGGTDSIRYEIAADTTVDQALALPASFEKLQFSLSNGATLTLAETYVSTDALNLHSVPGSGGTLINRGRIESNGPVFSSTSSWNNLSLINEGSLTAHLADANAYAVQSSYVPVENSGTITAIGGNGVRSDLLLTNSGTILADGTTVFAGTLENSGIIRSIGGTAVNLEYGGSTASHNSGTIDGAQVGARLYSSALVNSDMIRSAGTAVSLGYYSQIFNQADGVIIGGTAAIASPSNSWASGRVSVFNAGLIQGDVTLGSFYYGGSSNLFVALEGSRLEGNLHLGTGNDIFVTSLVNNGSGQYAGVSGTVTGTGSESLRYIVDGTVTTQANKTGIFNNVGYELVEGSALTLTAATSPTDMLVLSGRGSVDLNIDMSNSNFSPLVDLAATSLLPGDDLASVQSALTVTSHGILTWTRPNDYDYYGNNSGVVNLGGANVFDNAGTVRVSGTFLASGTGTFINNGGVELGQDSGLGNGEVTIDNRGIITGTPNRITTYGDIINSGLIDLTGAGLIVDQGNVINSGTIRSSQGPAIGKLNNYYYYGSLVRNEATGLIQGGTGGIAIRGVRIVDNAGVIDGSIDLTRPYGTGSIFISNGGTVNGDVMFGSSNDLFVQLDGNLGVTGRVDGGDGPDIFGRAFSSDTVTALGSRTDLGFELDYVEARQGATVTLAADAATAGTLYVGGLGSIVNLGTFDSFVTTDLPFYGTTGLPRQLGSFVNRGTLNGGLAANVSNFVNEGTLNGGFEYNAGITQYRYNGALSFDNSGTIRGGPQANAASIFGDGVTDMTIVNSGLVSGGIDVTVHLADPATGRFSLTNSGTIRSSRTAALSIAPPPIYDEDYVNGGTYSIVNSGLIESDGLGNHALAMSLYVMNASASFSLTNSGTIRARGDGFILDYSMYDYPDYDYITQPVAAVSIGGGDQTILNLTNEAGGIIEATGAVSTAIIAVNAPLRLDNQGLISGGPGMELTDRDLLASYLAAPYLAGAVQAGASNDSVTNSGTIIGSVDLGLGDDLMVNRGTIRGNVFLRGGNDSFTQQASGLVDGVVDGGEGTDSLIVDTTGNGSIDSSRFVGFERFSQVGNGEARYSGDFSFQDMQIASGRFTALAGSVIRALQINVASGATFGSAGTVIGDIAVAGTLSPGASPGTMTVMGNVALASGSTTLMELTPTAVDKLLISGKLTIASGATLQLAADQQVRPGTALDLIVADGGINGRYSTIVKSDGLLAFVIQQDERISLFGAFADSVGSGTQVNSAVTYINSVIAADAGSDRLYDALPVLATQSGASNPLAFARLTAEPYAASTQLAVETGLTIADAARNVARLSADEAPRAFAIGQYLSSLGRLAADGSAGLAASRSSGRGLMGGLGFGNDRWSVAGFGGWLDSRQSLRGLGSRTDADIWFAGAGASYAAGAFRLGATLAYLEGKADTTRLTPAGSHEQGAFRLKSWVGDLSLEMEALLGQDWALQPKVGVTWVSTKRTGLTESGGTVWALDVAGDNHDAVFADAGLGFGRSRASTAPLRPFVRLGVQYQLQGRGVDALAGLAGTGQDFLSLGARRAGLTGIVTGGAEMRLSQAISLYASASQSYSEDDRRASANVGLKFAF